MAASNIYDVLHGNIRATTSFIRPKRAEQDTPDLEMGTSSSTTPEEAGMQ